MEHKKKLVIFLLSLFFVLSVKADVKVILDCATTSINIGGGASCNLNLEYEQDDVKELKFLFSSDLGISFKESNIVQDVNSVVINFDNALNSSSKMITTIGTLNISAASNLQAGEHILSLENVSYKKSDESEITIANTSKTFNVVAKNDLIKGITVNGSAINNFSPAVYEYSNIVVHGQSVFIDVVKNEEEITVTGIGTIRVREGQSVTRVIHVEKGTESYDYTLIITNKKEEPAVLPDTVETKNGDNTLKSLEIYYEDNKLDFKFDSTKSSFMYVVKDNTIEKIEIKATLNNDKAHFDDLYFPKEYALDFGLNTFEILVIAENNDLRVYTLNLVREDFRDTDNTLSSIKVKNKEVELSDDKDKYTISVRGKITKEDIEAIANSTKAKIKVGEIRLGDETENVDITVTAENGEEKEYNLTINQLARGEVEDISINNYFLGFTKDVLEYDVTLKNDEKTLEINVAPNDLEYEVIGNENLKDGSKITIRFNYQDEIKDYVINIHKKLSGLPPIVCYIIFILGIGVLIASIVYFMKVTKK